MAYFIRLTETNTTINLDHLVSVEWSSVGEEFEGSLYTSTVNMSGGSGYYITRNDAGLLWRAIQRYNSLRRGGTSQAVTQSPSDPSETDERVRTTEDLNSESRGRIRRRNQPTEAE